MRLLDSLVAMVAVSGCGESTDMTAAKVEVDAAVHKYHELYDSGDIDALAEVLDPEVSFPVPPDQFLHGKDNVLPRIKKDIEEYVTSRDFQGKRKTRFGPIHITVNGTIAIARYDVNISDPGGVSAALFTRVFRKSSGKWLLLCEHYTVTPATKPEPNPKK